MVDAVLSLIAGVQVIACSIGQILKRLISHGIVSLRRDVLGLKVNHRFGFGCSRQSEDEGCCRGWPWACSLFGIYGPHGRRFRRGLQYSL